MDDAIAADARAAPGRSEDTQAEDQDGEEEEVADWTQFAKLLQFVSLLPLPFSFLVFD